MNDQHYDAKRYVSTPQIAGSVRLWIALRYLPALLLGSVMLLLLATARAEAVAAEDPEALGLNGVSSGHFLLRDTATGRYAPALIQASEVHFDISGMIATVTVQQTFRNDTDRYWEGVYVFPLPDNAAVRHLEMQVGDRLILGEIKEKAEAKAIYQAAKKAGKKASLVEQQRPNLFTNRVANIGPGEAITVRMEYVQTVDYNDAVFSLTFPMTITPRYMPGQPLTAVDAGDEREVLTVDHHLGWARPTNQVPDANQISPFLYRPTAGVSKPINPIKITATLDMGMPLAILESPYHEVLLSRRAGVYSIRLVNDVSEMDRDFILDWQPVSGATPKAALFTEKVGEEYYALLMVVPPAAKRMAPSIARDIVFVVDTSGSMGGVSIEQAKSSVSKALEQLRPQDYFNIVEFNSYHQALYKTSMPATRHYIDKAQTFVRQLDASGGTEMLPALRAVLSMPSGADQDDLNAVLRQVIFITDGAVGNEAALLEALSSNLGDSRLFTVSIGSAPNSWFMRKAAQLGRGTHTHIGDTRDVTDKMAALFEQLARPAAVDFQIEWPAAVDAWPERLPDLYQGQLLSAVANFGSTMPVGDITVSGQINGQAWHQRLQLDAHSAAEGSSGHAGVASVWARQKIAGLMDQKIAGREGASVRAEVLPLALKHRLLSPYTSFVAVEQVVSRPMGESADSKAVPNTAPLGQSPQTFAYPRTATTGPAKVWFGVFCLFLAMIIWVLRQPEVDHVPSDHE